MYTDIHITYNIMYMYMYMTVTCTCAVVHFKDC